MSISKMGRVIIVIVCVGNHSAKHQLFLDFYDKLLNVLPVTDLCPFFVSDKIISLTDNQRILRCTTSQMSAELLLEIISCKMQKGDSTVFAKMLVIMERHGIDAAKKLSQEIIAKLEDVPCNGAATLVDDDRGALFLDRYVNGFAKKYLTCISNLLTQRIHTIRL